MINIRELVASDKKLMEKFWNNLSRETLKWWHHYNSAEDILSEDSHKLIAIDKGKIVAYGFLLPDHNFPGAPSLGIVVSDEYRGGGIGTTMMKKLEAMARDSGYKNIFLTTYIENIKAISFFKKMGYKIQGMVERKAGYAYAMKKELLTSP